MLKDMKFGTVVVDECGGLRNLGKTHGAAVRLSRRSERALLLTASLHENNAYEVLNQLRVMDPDGLPWTDREFGDRYLEYVLGYRGDWVPFGVKEDYVDELRAHLRKWVHILSPEQAGVRMPTLHEEIWHVPLTDAQSREYRQRKYDQMDQGFLKRAIIAAFWSGESGVANSAVGWIAGQPRSRKILVRAEHLEHLDIVAKLLDARGIGHVRIDGGKTHGERADAVSVFRTDPSVQVLMGTKAMERGIDGCQVADVLISLLSSYNPAREAQAAGRICRIGSPHSDVFHMTFMPLVPVAQRKTQIVEKKRADGEALFGNWINLLPATAA